MQENLYKKEQRKRAEKQRKQNIRQRRDEL